MRYTDGQNTALYHRGGNLLIIACAGSGKTQVLSRRIALLISEGVPRESIVAFTFTDMAAGELKSRIEKNSPYYKIMECLKIHRLAICTLERYIVFVCSF